MYHKPNAFRLLTHIANTARRYNGHPDGLLIGQCHLQSWTVYGLTEREYRTAKEILVKRNHIKIIETNRTRKKSTTGSTTNSTLVQLCSLTIWDINPETTDDQNDDRATTERRQTRKKKMYKKNHPLTPSFSKSDGSDDDDDSFFSENIEKTQGKTHIYGDVWMGEDELAKCVAIKGSIEEVKYAVEAIIVSPGRSDTIKNWPNALSRWKIQPNIKPRLIENEEIAKELESRYRDFKDGKGIRCYVYNDRMKDIKGLLFEGDNPYKPVREFFAFSDVNFKEKVTRFQFEKKMAKGSLK